MAIEKQKLILISGIVLGIAAIVMTKVYLDQQQQAAQEQAKKAIATMQSNQAAVLVAKQDIPKGSTIAANMLDTQIVPNKFIQPQAATSLDRVSGMVTVAAISKGEQITFSKLVSSKQQSNENLAGLTPAGKRAISIAVDNISSLAGMIKPGDYVDVIATLQVPAEAPEGQQATQIAVFPLFQNVLVLAMGQNMSSPAASQGGSSRYAKEETSVSSGGPTLVTLALSPQDASFVAFVQEQGKIRLTLRSPADAKVEPIMPANFNTLFQYIMPQLNIGREASRKEEAKKEEAKKEEKAAPPVETIEIYRGINKERIPLSK